MIFGTKRIEQLEEKVKQLGLDNDLLKDRIDSQAALLKSMSELVRSQINENLLLAKTINGEFKKFVADEKNVIEELRRLKAREYARAYYKRKKAEKESAK
jgi:hypothetical protein